jgi:hypothetical protein
MAKKTSNKVSAVNLFKQKPKKNNKGVHSKNNKPEKKYRGQGRL